MGKLVHFRADGSAQDIKLDRERMTIGRRPDNDICLTHPAVSGEHAVIVTIFRDSFLEDLGSTNGTLVNGNRVTRYFLRNRDEIDVGTQWLVYLADDDAQVLTPPRKRPPPDDDSGERPAPRPVDSGDREIKRLDAQPSPRGRSSDPIKRFVAAEVASEARESEVEKTRIEQQSDGHASDSGFAVKVLSGAAAGRVLALWKAETLIGRAGIQVAALRRIGDGVKIVTIEGDEPGCVNSEPIPSDGRQLVVGDVLELAGARLEFMLSST